MNREEYNIRYLLELHNIIMKMDKSRRKQFYERKLDYYQFFIRIALIATGIASLGYLYSDYQLNGGNVYPTLIPRLSILIPLTLYIVCEHRIRDYRLKVFADYLLMHCIVWATIWSVYHLEDKTHFSEGSFSMNLIMLVIGLGSNGLAGICCYAVFFAELIISDAFNHYTNFEIIMSLNIPCAIAVLSAQFILSMSFLDHFLTELKLEKSLVTDPLTQVFNRQKLETMTEANVIEGAIMPVTVVMLDIDLFKSVNDTYGHYTGDQVLRYLGKKLTEHVRKSDYVIRYGGEEFLILMNGCSVGEAYTRMENIRADIQNADDRPAPFTVSAGVASYEGDFKAAVTHADEALYLSKNNGRNKVTNSSHESDLA